MAEPTMAELAVANAGTGSEYDPDKDPRFPNYDDPNYIAPGTDPAGSPAATAGPAGPIVPYSPSAGLPPDMIGLAGPAGPGGAFIPDPAGGVALPAPRPAPAPVAAPQAPPRPVYGGGYGRPIDFTNPLAGQQIGDLEDPTAFRARQRSDRQADIAKLGVSALGLSEADAAFMARAGLKPPGDVAKDLAAQVERGELSPEEAKRRGEAYRKGFAELQAKEKADEGKAKRYEQTWNSSEGLGTRLAGSQMAGQREVGEATRDMATIGADESERQAQMAQKQSAFLDQQARDEEQAAKAYQARRQAGQIHLEELGKKIDEGTPSISKFWSKEKNVGATVASVLGTLIGQVAQGVAAGGENAWTMTGQVASPSSKLDMSKLDGMALLERIVDRDLDEQQRELDTKKGEYDRELNFMAMGREAFGDDQLARQSARAAMLSQMAAESQAIAQQADSEKQRVAADLTAKQLDRMAQEQQLQFDLTLAQQAEIAKQRAMQAAAAAGAARAKAARAQEMAGKVQWTQDEKMRGSYSPIVGGFLRDPSSPTTQKQLQYLADLAALNQDLNEVYTLINTPGSSSPGSALNARLNSLALSVQDRMSVVQGQGQISDSAVERAGGTVPTGEMDLLNTDPARIKATIDFFSRHADTARAAISYQPGMVALRPDENGILREYAAYDPSAASGTVPDEGVKVGKQTYYEGTNEELARGRQANARFVPLRQQPGAAK